MKVVLAYSGGLDTSIILHWIKHTYDAEVIAYTEAAREAARLTGADEFVAEDLREEFVRDPIFPAVRANAVYEWYYLLGTALARPVIARGMMCLAAARGAGASTTGFPKTSRPWPDPRAAAERRTSHGGTAPAELARQLAELRRAAGLPSPQ